MGLLVVDCLPVVRLLEVRLLEVRLLVVHLLVVHQVETAKFWVPQIGCGF